ncbi:unnamed protein product, partial [Closterium sp. NIES-64]
MANSRYEYVKQFEQPDRLLPHCWIVIRIDGRGFSKCVCRPCDPRASFPDSFASCGA